MDCRRMRPEGGCIYNPYTPKCRGMSDIYSVAGLLFVAQTFITGELIKFRMALLVSGCFAYRVPTTTRLGRRIAFVQVE